MFGLGNIHLRADLESVAKHREKLVTTKKIDHSQLQRYQLQGWNVEKKYEKSIRIKRNKTGREGFTDRVWSLLYRMGFSCLNGLGPAQLTADLKTQDVQTFMIDIVGIDDEVAIAVWCRTSEETKMSLLEDLDYCIAAKQRLIQSIRQQPFFSESQNDKHQVAAVMFVSGIVISEEDARRAANGGIILFTEQELSYYEELVSHLDYAARYQFLADALSEKHIIGLDKIIPAIKTRVGEHTFYTFSLSPEYLLKIAYVSRRSKGKKSDVHAYQRMVQKSRLNEIRQYIDEKNIFPTNIVVNFEKNRLRFEKTVQEGKQEEGIMGWLHIEGHYKSALIIDGQHRLFAYSGHHFSETARLSILAFEGLPISEQAQLFVDINHEQKSVKMSLLNELFGTLNEDAKDPEHRAAGIVSTLISLLDEDSHSAFYHRILSSDDKKSELRCITTATMFSVLNRHGFYVQKKKSTYTFGPLWSEESNEAMRIRSMYIINSWFNTIRDSAPDWWNAGSNKAEGGLAMNDGVTSCFLVLHDVFKHIEENKASLVDLSKEDIEEKIKPFAQLLGKCLASFSEERKKEFRQMHGSQGQILRAKLWEKAMYEIMPSFNPRDLGEIVEKEEQRINGQIRETVDGLEKILKKVIIEKLKEKYGDAESQWWAIGIPERIREKASVAYERDGAKRIKRENHFYLSDYKEIISHNWSIFEAVFGYGKVSAKKEEKLFWLQHLNQMRNIASHASSEEKITPEDFAQLKRYTEWTKEQVKNLNQEEDSDEDVE